MFKINEEKIISEIKNKKSCNIPYFCGFCSSCEFYNENSVCKKLKLIEIIVNRIGKKSFLKKICKNWELNYNILNCFKQLINSNFSKQNNNGIGFSKIKYKNNPK